MKGSGASGNRRRAALRSPPCASGSAASLRGERSVALALLAMMIELCAGYPQALLRAVGHPVTWIGRLIAALDRALNRDTADANWRRGVGIVTILLLLGIVGTIAFVFERELLRLPFGLFAVAVIAST